MTYNVFGGTLSPTLVLLKSHKIVVLVVVVVVLFVFFITMVSYFVFLCIIWFLAQYWLERPIREMT